MEFVDYQNLSERTLVDHGSPELNLSNACIGLSGEVGEVNEMIKKAMFHGKALNIDALTLEIGDVLFYLAALCTELGIDMSSAAEANVEKLKERWPDGFKKDGM